MRVLQQQLSKYIHNIELEELGLMGGDVVLENLGTTCRFRDRQHQNECSTFARLHYYYYYSGLCNEVCLCNTSRHPSNSLDPARYVVFNLRQCDYRVLSLWRASRRTFVFETRSVIICCFDHKPLLLSVAFWCPSLSGAGTLLPHNLELRKDVLHDIGGISTDYDFSR